LLPELRWIPPIVSDRRHCAEAGRSRCEDVIACCSGIGSMC
jgi:hypothetical protein